MKKPTILIASVLKPVDDTRMYEKFASSLSSHLTADITIIGNKSSNIPVHTLIRFIMIPVTNRLIWTRFLNGVRHLRVYFKSKPYLLIITTHELLWPALILHFFSKTKIIYDVRENYFLNSKHTNAFPKILRSLIAGYVRFKEIITSPSIAHFTLAESIYSTQLPFLKNRFTILQNKALSNPDQRFRKAEHRIRIIFTGTLAESTGIYEAIDLVVKLHQIERDLQFTIVGYAALPSELKQIKNAIKKFRFIELIGGDHLVPHDQIITAIRQADFGIIHYPDSPHTKDKVPTKYYEYLANQLPFLIESKSPLYQEAMSYPACVSVDFRNPDEMDILANMKSTKFYESIPTGVTWESEEVKLIDLVRNTIPIQPAI